MAGVGTLVFYEKPGCVSNARQRALLAGLGHRLEVRDLLAEPWTPERLRPFFGDRPFAAWFNQTAPRVRSGDLPIDRLTEAEALALMVAEPILVRRPLMELDALRACGFEPGPLLDALGVVLAPDQDLQSCSRIAAPGEGAECPAPDTAGGSRG
jgi:nitrogenase-associated protein